MYDFLFKLFLFSIVVWLPMKSYAEPYLAIKTGMKCSGCHVNPTGGGKRNHFGTIYGQTSLSSTSAAKLGAVNPNLGKLNETISLGGNLRTLLKLQDSDEQEELEFDTQSGQLYIEVSPQNSNISLYVDEQIAPDGALNRETYALIYSEDRSLYLKAGRIIPPFGHRLEDDSAFTKQATVINFDNNDNGVEIGMESNKLFTTLTVSNGSGGGKDTDRKKQVILRSEFYQPNWRIGSSAYYNPNDAGERKMVSVFGGARIKNLVTLFEIDRIDDTTLENFSEQEAALVELNYTIKQGHNLKYSYEYLDQDIDIDENEQIRNSLVWEHSPIRHLQVRSGIRVNEGIPQSSVQNTKEGFVQLHLFF